MSISGSTNTQIREQIREIETALMQHPAVSEVTVTAVGESDKNQQLVAYVVPDLKNASALFEIEGNPVQIQNLWQSLVNTGHQKAQQPPESGIDLQTFSSLSASVERLSTAYICHTLRNMGVYIHPQERYSTRELLSRCQIQPRYQKLIQQWLSVLEEDRLLQRESEETFVNPHPLPIALDDCWHQVQQHMKLMPRESIPHLENNLRYLQQSADNHVAMLKGEVDPLELFFAQGALDTADSAYQFNPIANYYNSIAREIFSSVVQFWQPETPLKILEVGAGTGATTASLLPVLPLNRTVYTYTDVSTFFMEPAKKKFRNYPFVEYKQLDIEKSPQEQGYQLQSFDVIVAANVLHIAGNLSKTLSYIRSLLAPNGLLLLIELTQYNRTVMTTMGFVHGFSKFEDERVENNIPVLSVEKWHNTLQSHGFEKIVAFPETGSPTDFMGQNLIVARKSASRKQFKPYELHNFLKDRLPEYKIPSAYRLLDNIPLDENGRVDLRSLTAIAQVTPENDRIDNLSQEKTDKPLFQQASDRAQKRKQSAQKMQHRKVKS
ncbi:class I SAM-dependent methyltransferase [Chroococcidiopsis sp. CCNUC1]|uniref:class I SAM-dependent methyltransferase n=1 Tax=Chroococcidiopsis sp. CCNUC1 TaxID=2653189 RepID=UPI00201FDF0E|nr:methyltransferase [Chroococcidiopsis sp. CCNUC1]URD48568.1 methyltransferase [Chroococcidiopsis sp. CCNUC1]